MIAKRKANPELLAKLRRINAKLQRCAINAPHDYGYLLSVRDALLARIHAANIAQGSLTWEPTTQLPTYFTAGRINATHTG